MANKRESNRRNFKWGCEYEGCFKDWAIVCSVTEITRAPVRSRDIGVWLEKNSAPGHTAKRVIKKYNIVLECRANMVRTRVGLPVQTPLSSAADERSTSQRRPDAGSSERRRVNIGQALGRALVCPTSCFLPATFRICFDLHLTFFQNFSTPTPRELSGSIKW